MSRMVRVWIIVAVIGLSGSAATRLQAATWYVDAASTAMPLVNVYGAS